MFLGVCVYQVPLLIKALTGIPDHDLGFVECVHV
jgi:hypothetical protein